MTKRTASSQAETQADYMRQGRRRVKYFCRQKARGMQLRGGRKLLRQLLLSGGRGRLFGGKRKVVRAKNGIEKGSLWQPTLRGRMENACKKFAYL
jgi:hypothetical protein